VLADLYVSCVLVGLAKVFVSPDSRFSVGSSGLESGDQSLVTRVGREGDFGIIFDGSRRTAGKESRGSEVQRRQLDGFDHNVSRRACQRVRRSTQQWVIRRHDSGSGSLFHGIRKTTDKESRGSSVRRRQLYGLNPTRLRGRHHMHGSGSGTLLTRVDDAGTAVADDEGVRRSGRNATLKSSGDRTSSSNRGGHDPGGTHVELGRLAVGVLVGETQNGGRTRSQRVASGGSVHHEREATADFELILWSRGRLERSSNLLEAGDVLAGDLRTRRPPIIKCCADRARPSPPIGVEERVVAVVTFGARGAGHRRIHAKCDGKILLFNVKKKFQFLNSTEPKINFFRKKFYQKILFRKKCGQKTLFRKKFYQKNIEKRKNWSNNFKLFLSFLNLLSK
jgi:hypothetical protein